MALFSSLPVMWGEGGAGAALAADSGPGHWLRRELAAHGAIVPLDRLGSPPAIPDDIDLLVIAQPRPLAPDENVALDDWVRRGGRVLLFADPQLTEDSAFAPGDPRRPQDMVLLSPILAHWGLRLDFDPAQDAAEQVARPWGVAIPVRQAGRFARISGGEGCSVEPSGLGAECRIGRGRVLAIADAALLEGGEGVVDPTRRDALRALLAKARGE